MSIGSRLSILCAAALAATASAAVSVSTDRADARYRAGETVTFTVTPDTETPAVPLKAVMSLDNGKQLSAATIQSDKGGKFTGKLDAPGVLTLRVTGVVGGKKINVAAGAAVEPEKIVPGAPAPADFNEFWAGELAKAAQVPLDPKVTKLDKFSNDKYTSYEVSLAVPGGRIHGFLCVPNKPGRLPALIGIEPSGSGRATPVVNQFGNRKVVFWLNVHDFSPSLGSAERGKAYKAINTPVMYYLTNRNDRDKYYFHRVLLGLSRAVDYLASRPEVDPGRIGAWGVSQGGGLALMVTALNPKIKAVCANVPALCDHHAFKQDRFPGWPRLVDPKDEATSVCAGYYDTVNFCRNIKVPTWIIAGLGDDTCPPAGVCAAFNVIPAAQKDLVLEPSKGHSGASNAFGNSLSRMRVTINRLPSGGK